MRVVVAFAALMACGHALAQEHHPYAGLEQRTVKALSDQQIADLRAGRGMGLALPAELNGYPGPAHVLENADALGLTLDQLARTKSLFKSMQAEAVPLGEQLIKQEMTLDHLFAEHRIDAANLEAITREIGLTQARLRQTHLKYHLAMMDVLSQAQVEKYQKLRGYGTSSDSDDAARAVHHH